MRRVQSQLAPIAEPLPADPALFDEVVNNATVPVLVDFWAGGAGLAAQPRQRSRAQPRIWLERQSSSRSTRRRIRSWLRASMCSGIPNFVVLSRGRPVFQQAGLVGHEQMEQWLHSAAA